MSHIVGKIYAEYSIQNREVLVFKRLTQLCALWIVTFDDKLTKVYDRKNKEKVQTNSTISCTYDVTLGA